MSDRETITIVSRLPNGLRLHVQGRISNRRDPFEAVPMFEDMGWLDFAKFTPASATGPGMAARTESFNVVDKEKWDVWVAENKGNPMLTGGMLSVYEPPKDGEPEPERPAHRVGEGDSGDQTLGTEHPGATRLSERPKGETEGEKPHDRMSDEELEKATRPDGGNV